MKYCSVPQCSNSERNGYSMFTITRRRREKLKWLNILKLPQTKSLRSVICEGHFTSADFETVDARGTAELKRNAVPSIITANPPRVLEDYVVADLLPLPAESSALLRKCQVFKGTPPEEPQKYIPVEVSKEKRETNGCSSSQSSQRLSPSVVEAKLKSMEERIESLQNANNQLQNEKDQLKVQVDSLEERRRKFLANEHKILNEDQKLLLERDTSATNTRKWSNKTIQSSLRIRIQCGARAYESLRLNEKWPLPSLCVINSRVRRLDFIPGKFSQIIDMLGKKLSHEKLDHSKFCVISLDEMGLTPLIEYDKGLRTYLGFISPTIAGSMEEQKKKATHCLAVMVRGLSVHWKQLVTYVLTGNSIDVNQLWEFLKGIIIELHKRNIHVVAVSSDMGGTNQALWTKLGIFFNRHKINPYAVHPCPSTFLPKMLFSPDVPHLIKNLWGQLLRTCFIVSEDWCKKHGLTSQVVAPYHVQEYIQAQGKVGAKPVHRLTSAVLEPNKFEKMRVPMALQIFSEKLGHAIITAANLGVISPAAKTTGTFILHTARWYQIMSSRSKFTALDKSERARNDLKFLSEFSDTIQDLKFWRIEKGTMDCSWKPVQGGIILANSVVKELYVKMVENGPLEYILPSRLFSSPCENLFCQVRSGGDSHPKPVRLRHMLRLVSVAQFVRASSSNTYEDDDESYYLDFLEGKSATCQKDWVFDEEEIDTLSDVPHKQLTALMKQGAYFLAGWAAFQVKGNCPDCDRAMIAPQPEPNLPSQFVEAINKGGLTHPTWHVWNIVTYCEDIFLAHGNLLLHTQNVPDKLLAALKKRCEFMKHLLPKCHDVIHLIGSKIISLRLHTLAADASSDLENPLLFNSASAFMRTAVQNCRDANQKKLLQMYSTTENVLASKNFSNVLVQKSKVSEKVPTRAPLAEKHSNIQLATTPKRKMIDTVQMKPKRKLFIEESTLEVKKIEVKREVKSPVINFAQMRKQLLRRLT